jgi:Phage tail sheath protein FI
MPEYLSPGVYVEEVNSGSKPIEGVSTSTAGMVGVTERGPENVPVLVTSYGEYRRVFGGELRLSEFTGGNGRVHGYLPHAVQGFFQNDGRRNYVVRVLPDAATAAQRTLFDQGAPGSADTMLLRAAPQGSGTATNLPLLYALSASPPGAGDWIRIGSGSRAEYRRVAAVDSEARHVALAFALDRSHAVGTTVEERGIVEDTDNYTADTVELADAVNAGATSIVVVSTDATSQAALVALAGSGAFELGTAPRAEYVVATASEDLGDDRYRLTLSAPLQQAHAAGEDITPLNLTGGAATTATLSIAANAGEQLLYVDSLGGGFPSAAGNRLVVIDPGSGNMEVRRLGTLSQFALDLGLYDEAPAGTRLERVTLEARTSHVDTSGGVSTVDLGVDGVEGLVPGLAIDVGGEATVIAEVNAVDGRILLQIPLSAAPANGTVITPAAKSLTADVSAGRVVIALDNRLGLAADDVIRIGTGPDAEYATIAAISGERGAAPDAGSVVLRAPLRSGFANGTEVVVLRSTVDTAQQSTSLVLPAEEGATTLYVGDGTGFAAGEIVRLTLPSGPVYFHALTGVDTSLQPRELTLDPTDPLDFSHEAGAPLVGREGLIDVFALDRGAWGNRLQVAISDNESSLVQAQLTAASGITPVISLSNYTNLEAGTVLEFIHPHTNEPIGAPAKVVSVDRAAGEVSLSALLDGAVVTAFNTLSDPVRVRSREFILTVFLLQRPDPAVPSRNNTVIDSESFLVTMDPRHSRYIHKVIGTTWTPGAEQDDDGIDLRLWDRRSVGESRYIRVRDRAAGNQALLESIRLGPELLFDQLDNGQWQAARLGLAGGTDAIDSLVNDALGDAIYLGTDSDEPRLRTGIHALSNIRDISIVAVPGQTTVGVQQALINHCENDRYRFAVLDAHPPARDTLVDVQAQRQAFDSKYAALYHPWLTIPEPLPANVASIRQLPIPPSGHIMGIYARVDNTRGVHKAPANEVVRGITGLTRNLNSREQDLLNPFPKNINVIRDFREANRGLRVWGARCITSDSDYKYVNVRRLMIFLEASIDQGLQWVVFEPNAEPLWAKVRRAVSNFLTVVWRNGALEGTTVEQAFFVRCDRTTMTQTDIDSGRLIIEIGVAPVKPAEFVIVRIGLWTASAD